jgi:hypothetical protein
MKQLLAFLKATLLGGVLLMSFKDFTPPLAPPVRNESNCALIGAGNLLLKKSTAT